MHKRYYKQKVKKCIYQINSLYSIRPKDHLDGIRICQILHDHNVPTTLGKFSKEGDDPKEIIHEYQLASKELKNKSGPGGFYLSVKPPALHFNTDYIQYIANIAIKNGSGVHFDSHDYLLTEKRIQVLQELIDKNKSFNNMNSAWSYGITIPSRWKRSFDDVQWAIRENVRIRLVKGEFKANKKNDEMEACKGFLKLTEMITNHVPQVAVATHDYQLAKEAIKRLKDSKVPVELELLYGMPVTNMIHLSREMNIGLRFYVAYSDTLFLYGIKQFIVNPYKLLRPGFKELFASHNLKMLNIISKV